MIVCVCECVRVCVLLVGFLSSKKGTDQEKKIIEMNKRERETGQKEEGEKETQTVLAF